MKKYIVKILNENISVNVNEGDHILKGIARYNSSHKANGCRNGGCGVCKIRIVSGEFEVKKWSKEQVSDEEFEKGYALACRVFPKSDMVIEYIGKNNKK
ncbi:MAG: 2Fe-2S iron-sulfur cluster binding domain-containing protein [Ruminococcaceae bacterium]|nr:2Fe-2S iron-sulfur cluster binding domain-containing protein [Oscillospiraceae bacterium]